jgi:hypothetical protein
MTTIGVQVQNNNNVNLEVNGQPTIELSVQDGNNVQLNVTPQPRIELFVDKGVQGPTGATGATGATGPQGQGLEITGEVANVEDLPNPGQVGDQFFVQATQSVYVWSAT